MTLVAPAGAYYDSLQTFGHLPGGPRGSVIGAGAGIAAKLAYRGAKYLGRRFLRPKKYTYSGATGRGIAIGTGIASFLGGGEDDINAPFPTPTGETSNRFQQGNRRFRRANRSRRGDNRHRHRCCC